MTTTTETEPQDTPKEKTPTLSEIIKANDELFTKILAQLDAINSDIQTINNQLRNL